MKEALKLEEEHESASRNRRFEIKQERGRQLKDKRRQKLALQVQVREQIEEGRFRIRVESEFKKPKHQGEAIHSGICSKHSANALRYNVWYTNIAAYVYKAQVLIEIFGV